MISRDVPLSLNNPEAAGKILVCFALKEEANPFRKRLGDAPRVQMLITGMGRRNTEAAMAGALAHSRPEIVLTAGVAGGLRPGVSLGTVLVQTPAESGLEKVLVQAGARRGKIVCADRVASTSEEKKKLHASTGADAVEMESGHIMTWCARENIRAATVRVVLDTAEETLPLDFNALMDKNQRMDYWKLAKVLMRSPGKIPALIRLQRRSSQAAESLAKVLVEACKALREEPRETHRQE